MRILEEVVEQYLRDLRPERSAVMREMEEHAERDSIPIAPHGRAARARTRDHAGARPRAGGAGALLLERGGVADRVELLEGDALETLPGLEGPFDMLFVDASKGEYARYIELAEPKLTERALMVVDNLLMRGEVALPEDAETWVEPGLAGLRAPAEHGPARLRQVAGMRAAGGRRDRRGGAALGR